MGQIGACAEDRDGAGRGQPGRQIQPDLGQIGPVERGVIGGSARGEHDMLRPALGDHLRHGRNRGDVSGFEQVGVDGRLFGYVSGHALAALICVRHVRSLARNFALSQ